MARSEGLRSESITDDMSVVEDIRGKELLLLNHKQYNSNKLNNCLIHFYRRCEKIA